MNIVPLSIEAAPARTSAPPRSSFGDAMAAALDSAAAATSLADREAAGVSTGGADVMGASLTRAKADVLLDVVAVAASRISSAINTLMQTQV